MVYILFTIAAVAFMILATVSILIGKWDQAACFIGLAILGRMTATEKDE